MANTYSKQSYQLVLPPYLVGYNNLFTEYKDKDGKPMKYNAQFLIPKLNSDGSPHIVLCQKSKQNIIEINKELFKEMKFSGHDETVNKALKDGDKAYLLQEDNFKNGKITEEELKNYEIFKGHYLLTASNKERPVVYSIVKDERGQWKTISEKKECYPGMKARALIELSGYDMSSEGKAKGIGCKLIYVQKIEDGERIQLGKRKTVGDASTYFVEDDSIKAAAASIGSNASNLQQDDVI